MNTPSPDYFEKLALKNRLEDVTTFLEPLLPLANCHMVDFITANLWELVIPVNLRQEFESTDSPTSLINDACWNIFQKVFNRDCLSNNKSTISPEKNQVPVQQFCSVFDYMVSSRDASLLFSKDITVTFDRLKGKMSLGSDCSSFHFEHFMTNKKAHEVEVMATIAASLANACQTSYVIDIGSGKGYLSSMLSLHHDLNVLGIDSSSSNTHGAATRIKKLLRVCKSIPSSFPQEKSGSSLSNLNHQSNSLNLNQTLFKQATVFVTPTMDLDVLVAESFPDSSPDADLTLVGLHTCGDLSPTALRLFVSNARVKGLCNVGCCYHLLNEERGLESLEDRGFPMSNFLGSKNFALERNARMLAAQSLERTLNSQNSFPSVNALFYRALLQVLLKEKCGKDLPEKHVGRLAAKCTSFTDYVFKAIKKLGLELEVSEAEIEALYKRHAEDREKLGVFFVLRLILAPVIECIVLLDRVLFLHEQGIRDAYLVPMFDPLVSPRGHGIVAWKM